MFNRIEAQIIEYEGKINFYEKKNYKVESEEILN